MSMTADCGTPDSTCMARFVAESKALLACAKIDRKVRQTDSLSGVIHAIRATRERADRHSLTAIASLAVSLEQVLLSALRDDWTLSSLEITVVNRCLDRLIQLLDVAQDSSEMDVSVEKDALRMVDIVHRASAPNSIVVFDDNLKGLRDVVLRCARDRLQQYSAELVTGASPVSST